MPEFDDSFLTLPDDFDLARVIQSNDAERLEPLREALGDDVFERLAELSVTDTDDAAGLVAPPDPALPEIVLLHGITDCHLTDVSKQSNRIWLDYLELIKGRFTRKLTLQSDGSDQPHTNIKTNGYLKKKYGKALRAWRGQRFRCQVFCYDWRHSVIEAADHLNTFLQSLASVQAGEKVVLVGHSMGGLVAATYAAKHSEWKSTIQQAVFVGSPLGGSYSVPLNVLGHSKSVRSLDRLSVSERLHHFQRMLASFPGLIDMLPRPDLFPEVADLYTLQGWPGTIKPHEKLLDASRALKDVLWGSPIFERSVHLISQGHKTVSAMPWAPDGSDREVHSNEPGDGSALSKSSLVPGLQGYLVSGEHGTLVNETQVYEAVMNLARGEDPGLKGVVADDLGKSSTAITGSATDTESAAGLIAPPEASDSIIKGREEAVGEALGLFFLRREKVKRLETTWKNQMDRVALQATDFSWRTALSLAVASDFAYQSDHPDLPSLAKETWGFDGYEPIANDDTEGFVCWDDVSVILSFRGTEKKLSDWVRNLKMGFTHDTNGRYGKVHRGFYQGYDVVKTQVVSALSKAGAKGKKLYLTGHSLGGAVAVIAGAELVGEFPVEGVYTYGQPKVGRTELEAFYRKHYDGRCFRFRNNDDLVTRIPPNFSHLGKLIWFDDEGQVKGNSAPAGLVEDVIDEVGAKDELSEAEFNELQDSLNEICEPAGSDALFLPPTDDQAEGLLGLPRYFADHSISKRYIPIIEEFVKAGA